jgi:uncharacterized protein YjbI with pentapeptide repeats
MGWRRIPTHWLPTLAGVGAILLALFVLWGGPWLFTRHPDQGLTAEQELTAKNDVRTTLVQAVAGLAVASGAIVTYRAFRHSRVEQDRAYQLNQSHQLTQTFTQAVEQLGHEQAPVRLGALYSLMSLAQDNPARRQTVVDVLCAYLRMPYTPPTSAVEPAAAATAPRESGLAAGGGHGRGGTGAAQELQVRQTAQRLLADHLRRDGNSQQTAPVDTFWPGISLDLTGATLVGFLLYDATVVNARFTESTFVGDAEFDQAEFSGLVSFDRAIFSDSAIFRGTSFSGRALFRRTTFSGAAWFDRATFHEPAIFHGADFRGVASFDGTAFASAAGFDGARFARDAVFHAATFTRHAVFHSATFAGAAGFDRTNFARDAVFHAATFTRHALFHSAAFDGAAVFDEATFSGVASFSKATFEGRVSFDATAPGVDLSDAHARHPDDPDVDRRWPDGWALCPDADDRARGTLVRDNQATTPRSPGSPT